MLGALMQVIDTSIVNVAIPQMMGNLGATLDQIGWVATGYIIAQVIVLPLTGWLSSTFGRKRYLAASMMIFTAASFLCGTSTSLTELIIYRILQGAGGAALIATAQATMMEIFPPHMLGPVQAIYGIGIMAGPTIGPTLGGYITDNYSWPWVFFINVPIGILATVLTWIYVHDSPHKRAASGIDLVGISFLAIGLGSLQTVLERGNREDWFHSDFITSLAFSAAAGLIAFVIWELRVEHPAVNLHILRNRGFAAGSVIATVLGFGLYGGIFILPVYLQELRGYSAWQTGWMIFPGAAATAVVMPVAGRVVSMFSPRRLVAVGLVAFIVSMYWLTKLTMDTGLEQLFWPLVVRGAAMGFLFVPLTLATLLSIPARNMADGTGLFNLFRQLGGSAGIAFLATFVDHRTDVHRTTLVERISVYNPVAIQRLADVQQWLMTKGYVASVAKQKALALFDRMVQAQAMVMSYADAFLVIGIVFACVFPLLLLFKKGRIEEIAH
jgi:DHA2 family multidrug resistance protein